MFDIGFLELVLIGVLALLVLGPERLPHAARTAGKWVGKAKRMASNLTDELDRQVKIDELQKKIDMEGDSIKVDEVQKTIQDALDQAEKFKHLVNSDATENLPSTEKADLK
jgi:sec-independent protein translocase protein TatB